MNPSPKKYLPNSPSIGCKIYQICYISLLSLLGLGAGDERGPGGCAVIMLFETRFPVTGTHLCSPDMLWFAPHHPLGTIHHGTMGVAIFFGLGIDSSPEHCPVHAIPLFVASRSGSSRSSSRRSRSSS